MCYFNAKTAIMKGNGCVLSQSAQLSQQCKESSRKRGCDESLKIGLKVGTTNE